MWKGIWFSLKEADYMGSYLSSDNYAKTFVMSNGKLSQTYRKSRSLIPKYAYFNQNCTFFSMEQTESLRIKLKAQKTFVWACKKTSVG